MNPYGLERGRPDLSQSSLCSALFCQVWGAGCFGRSDLLTKPCKWCKPHHCSPDNESLSSFEHIGNGSCTRMIARFDAYQQKSCVHSSKEKISQCIGLLSAGTSGMEHSR